MNKDSWSKLKSKDDIDSSVDVLVDYRGFLLFFHKEHGLRPVVDKNWIPKNRDKHNEIMKDPYFDALYDLIRYIAKKRDDAFYENRKGDYKYFNDIINNKLVIDYHTLIDKCLDKIVDDTAIVI